MSAIEGSTPSESNDRVRNNVLRHEYRTLSEIEKQQMRQIKDLGMDLMAFVEALTPCRETSIAKTKIEEAVMWAVKAITDDPAQRPQQAGVGRAPNGEPTQQSRVA
jgi:queuine/archaeosine tRNA-ribosyltransferase